MIDHDYDSLCGCSACRHIELALQERPARVLVPIGDELRRARPAAPPPADLAAALRERLFGAAHVDRASAITAAGDTPAARGASDVDLQRYRMSPARRSSLVLAALAARVVHRLIAEQLDDESAVRELAERDDPAAQRPVLELARHLLAQVDEHFARTARLAPRVHFAGAHVSLAGAFQVEDELLSRLNDLTQGLAATLETLRGGNVDEALFQGEEVLHGGTR